MALLALVKRYSSNAFRIVVHVADRHVPVHNDHCAGNGLKNRVKRQAAGQGCSHLHVSLLLPGVSRAGLRPGIAVKRCGFVCLGVENIPMNCLQFKNHPVKCQKVTSDFFFFQQIKYLPGRLLHCFYLLFATHRVYVPELVLSLI